MQGAELSVPAEGGVEVGAFAVGGDERAAGWRIFAGIADFDQGCVCVVPSAGEVESSFLNPAVPRLCSDFVGQGLTL